MPSPLLVYSPRYDISLYGLERLHPFDAKKFSRAWDLIQGKSGVRLASHWIEPPAPIAEADLLRVHTPAYLAQLSESAVLARALEVWPLRLVPNALLQRRVLEPMRYAAAGTLLAAARALEGEGRVVMNIGGGFHHAFPDHGEGFCLFADVAIAIEAQRAAGALRPDDSIAVIDLDAHRGNGFWSIAAQDPAIHVLDVYNYQAYPGPLDDEDAFPFQVPVRAQVNDHDYLAAVSEVLPRFLASVGNPKLAIYNAGTDVVAGDPIGKLAVSLDGVAARDRLVMDTLLERRIPTVVVTSGGYTDLSHQLIARLALHILDQAPR